MSANCEYVRVHACAYVGVSGGVEDNVVSTVMCAVLHRAVLC